MAKFIRVSEAYSTVINYIATLDEEYNEKTIDVLRKVAKSLCNLPSVTINEPSMQEVAYKSNGRRS